jgi:hypothetical protein
MDMRKLEKEIAQITASHGCTLYGFADLEGLTPGELSNFSTRLQLLGPGWAGWGKTASF